MDFPLILAPHERKCAPLALRVLCTSGFALATLLLAACSTVSRGSLESLRLAVQRQTVHPTPESVAAAPYYQLQVNAPGGEAILILAHVAHGDLGWYGNDHDAVTTHDGVVVRTAGLPSDLDGSAFNAGNPFQAGLQHLTAPVAYTRRMDWSPGYRYGVVMQGSLTPGRLEDVEILGTMHHLQRVDEDLRAPGQGIHLSNRYWVDPSDGFVWKSQQEIAPGYTLELIALRPYRESGT